MALFMTNFFIWVALTQLFVAVLIIGAAYLFYERLNYLGRIKVDPAYVFRKKDAVETVKKQIENMGKNANFG